MSHTRGNTKELFKHVFSIHGDDVAEVICTALKESGVETIFALLGYDLEEVDDLTYQERALNKKEKQILKTTYEWICWETANNSGVNYKSLTMEDYDAYLTWKGTKGLITAPTPTPAPTPIPIYSTTSQVMPAPFASNVKLDVKQYPVFNGEIANWSKFKRGVLALAATHNLDDVFDIGFTVPSPNSTAYSVFQEKNKFVYSIWISRVTGGLALSMLRQFENDKDGRGAYLKFLEVYEGKHNMGQVALLALARLNALHLSYNFPGGVPVFISKFRDALQDLKDAKEPVSDAMAKSMLLSKIQDNNYRHIVDILLDSPDDYEKCITRLLDKYNMMNQSKGSNPN